MGPSTRTIFPGQRAPAGLRHAPTPITSGGSGLRKCGFEMPPRPVRFGWNGDGTEMSRLMGESHTRWLLSRGETMIQTNPKKRLLLPGRMARVLLAAVIALAALVATATSASAQETCTGVSGSHSICFSIEAIGNNDFTVHIGIDRHMSRQDAEAILAGSSNPSGRSCTATTTGMTTSSSTYPSRGLRPRTVALAPSSTGSSTAAFSTKTGRAATRSTAASSSTTLARA